MLQGALWPEEAASGKLAFRCLHVGVALVFEHIQPVVGPYAPAPPACREYDPRAVDVARAVARAISDHLPQVGVEHVGSTAVPGCAGSGIVDLLIPVPAGQMETLRLLLARLGFQPQTGDDPFPEQRPMRVGAWNHQGETFLLHAHLVPADSPEVDEMRFFRSCLRADPELQRAYVAHKRAILAPGVADSQEYARRKSEFVKMVLG